MVRAEAPSELCQEPGTKALVLGPSDPLGGEGPWGQGGWPDEASLRLGLVQPVQDLLQGLP